jgi:hypothetical protein
VHDGAVGWKTEVKENVCNVCLSGCVSGCLEYGGVNVKNNEESKAVGTSGTNWNDALERN